MEGKEMRQVYLGIKNSLEKDYEGIVQHRSSQVKATDFLPDPRGI